MSRWFGKAGVALLLVKGCGGAPPPPAAPPEHSEISVQVEPDPDAWRHRRPDAARPRELDYPETETMQLDNGLSLYVVRRPAGVVTMSAVARGGASGLPAGRSGLAALTARMMTEGTRGRSSLALAEAVESLGSSLQHDAGRDHVSIGIASLQEDLPKALRLLSEVVRSPAFDRRELERVRAEWLARLSAERQQPQRLAALAGLRLLVGDAEGAPVNGTPRDVRRLTRNHLLTFHAERFVPRNVALVIVGDVTLEEARAEAASAFGDWRGRAPIPSGAIEPPEAPASTRIVLMDRPGSVQTALFVAQPFPRRGEDGHEARQVLNNLLGGLFTSRLNTQLREEQGYTYGVRSLSIANEGWGAFVVSTSVKTEVTADAVAAIVSELEAVQDEAGEKPIDDAELSRAKTDLVHQVGASLEHVDSVATRTQQLFVHQLPADYYRSYPGLLRAIDRESAVREAKARLLPDRLLIVAVGDRARIEPELRERWRVESFEPKRLE